MEHWKLNTLKTEQLNKKSHDWTNKWKDESVNLHVFSWKKLEETFRENVSVKGTEDKYRDGRELPI